MNIVSTINSGVFLSIRSITLCPDQEILDILKPGGGKTMLSTFAPWKLQLRTNILESPADSSWFYGCWPTT